MTEDEAREAFDAALEGELDAARRAAFEAALAASPALAAEYEAFVATMRIVRGVGLDERTSVAEAPAEVVEGVRRTLRVRSRGRFYRDRFAGVSGRELVLPIVLAIALFLLCVVALAGRRIVVLEGRVDTNQP